MNSPSYSYYANLPVPPSPEDLPLPRPWKNSKVYLSSENIFRNIIGYTNSIEMNSENLGLFSDPAIVRVVKITN